MPIQKEMVCFGPNGAHSGLLVLPPNRPEDLPLPAVLLIQEAWGLDAHIEDQACRFAGAGYAVLAPDLFAEGGVRKKGLESAPIQEARLWMDSLPVGTWMDPGRRKQALAAEEPAKAGRVEATLDAVFGGIQADRERHLGALEAAVKWLKETCVWTKGGRVAAVGYCMGGALSGRLAARPAGLSGAVIFYGQAPEPGQAASVACPVLAFYGENDSRTSASLPPFEQAMRAAGKSLESHLLKGAGHAFLNDTRPSFHPSAARASVARTLGFLNEVLG